MPPHAPCRMRAPRPSQTVTRAAAFTAVSSCRRPLKNEGHLVGAFGPVRDECFHDLRPCDGRSRYTGGPPRVELARANLPCNNDATKREPQIRSRTHLPTSRYTAVKNTAVNTAVKGPDASPVVVTTPSTTVYPYRGPGWMGFGPVDDVPRAHAPRMPLPCTGRNRRMCEPKQSAISTRQEQELQ
eukprot:scaffold6760_cov119-Isochrysis_galbana.AAC.5